MAVAGPSTHWVCLFVAPGTWAPVPNIPHRAAAVTHLRCASAGSFWKILLGSALAAAAPVHMLPRWRIFINLAPGLPDAASASLPFTCGPVLVSLGRSAPVSAFSLNGGVCLELFWI